MGITIAGLQVYYQINDYLFFFIFCNISDICITLWNNPSLHKFTMSSDPDTSHTHSSAAEMEAEVKTETLACAEGNM